MNNPKRRYVRGDLITRIVTAKRLEGAACVCCIALFGMLAAIVIFPHQSHNFIMGVFAHVHL